MDSPSLSPATPCVGICAIDPLGGPCIGCGRSIAEISLWPETTDEQRRAVMSVLSGRMARAGRAGSRADRRERQPWR